MYPCTAPSGLVHTLHGRSHADARALMSLGLFQVYLSLEGREEHVASRLSLCEVLQVMSLRVVKEVVKVTLGDGGGMGYGGSWFRGSGLGSGVQDV